MHDFQFMHFFTDAGMCSVGSSRTSMAGVVDVDGVEDAGRVTKIVFGEQQIDVPMDEGITLAQVREAFGFEDRGILMVPSGDGGRRPIATVADDEVPYVVGVEVEFVVSDDPTARDDGAIVQQLIALGAALASSESALADEPYKPAPLPYASMYLGHHLAYDPWSLPGRLSDACQASPYRLAFDAASTGPRPDVVEESATGDDPWGIMMAVGSVAAR
jgi:hypothetical protein